jgi:hypothetical protein
LVAGEFDDAVDAGAECGDGGELVVDDPGDPGCFGQRAPDEVDGGEGVNDIAEAARFYDQDAQCRFSVVARSRQQP